MKTATFLAVTTTLATLSFPAMAQTPKSVVKSIFPEVSTWKAGKAATHAPVKDQGNIGFCWANAWASYLESKVLIEKGTSIKLSTLYLGRAHMADEFISTLKQMTVGPIVENPSNEILSQDGLTVLSRYQGLANDPVSLEATKQFFIRKLQKYSHEELEGNSVTQAPTLGVVPVSVYEKPKTTINTLGPVAGPIPPYENRYLSPDNATMFKDFISDRLLSSSDMDKYLGLDGKNSLERDFDNDIGNTPIAETDSFTFEGTTYTPTTFLENYIGINSSDVANGVTQDIGIQNSPQLKYGRARKENFNESVANIVAQLKVGRPVLLSMLVLDDLENNDPSIPVGIFDPSYCNKPGECKRLGGHAVMVVNTMRDASGHIKALIVQNSWGPQGVNQNGGQTKVRADRGFNIVTMNYLRAAMKLRPYAFSYILI